MSTNNALRNAVLVTPPVFVLCLSCLTALCTTRYVDPWQSPHYWVTPEMAAWELQRAIGDAEERDEVVVGPGSYRGNLTLKKGVALTGSQPDRVIISGAEPTKPSLTLTWDNTVTGITIYGSRYEGSGIYAELGVPPGKNRQPHPFPDIQLQDKLVRRVRDSRHS